MHHDLLLLTGYIPMRCGQKYVQSIYKLIEGRKTDKTQTTFKKKPNAHMSLQTAAFLLPCEVTKGGSTKRVHAVVKKP